MKWIVDNGDAIQLLFVNCFVAIINIIIIVIIIIIIVIIIVVAIIIIIIIIETNSSCETERFSHITNLTLETTSGIVNDLLTP